MKRGFVLLGLLCTGFLWSSIALADVELKGFEGLFDRFTVGGDFHLFTRYTENPYFGAPFGENNDTSTGEGEFIAKLRFTGYKNLGWTELEAQVGGAFNGTIGQDFYGLYKDEVAAESDTAYLKFNKLFHSPVDVTIGEQNIQLEKWFLVGSGRYPEAAAWLAYLNSFLYGVRVDGDFGPLKVNTFWAMTKEYYQQWDQWDPDLRVGKEDVSGAGVNFHLDITHPTGPCLFPAQVEPKYPFARICESSYVYAGYYRKIDNSDLILHDFVDDLPLLSENNTNAYDIGMDFTFGGLNLEGEFVYENGDAGRLGRRDLDRNAFGGFGAAKYTFNLPYKPYLKGWYIYYSGDKDLDDDTAEDFDPMFNGFLSWNKWVIGELVGEAHLMDSNKEVIIGEAGFSPRENINVIFMYLNHTLVEPYFGAGGQRFQLTAKDWADEFNLFVETNLTENLFLHVGGGYVIPDSAAEQVFGNDDNALFGQVWFWFHF